MGLFCVLETFRKTLSLNLIRQDSNPYSCLFFGIAGFITFLFSSSHALAWSFQALLNDHCSSDFPWLICVEYVS